MTEPDARRRPRGLGSWFFKALPTLGGSAAFLMGVFGVLAYFLPLDVKAPVGWTIVAAFVPLPFVAMLGHMLRMALGELAERPIELPRVIRCLPSSSAPGGQLLLVEASQLLGQGIAVSVYVITDEFEILIGEGLVQVVQQNGKIQVVVTKFADGAASVWQNITENSPDTLKRTLVRPGHQIDRSN